MRDWEGMRLRDDLVHYGSRIGALLVLIVMLLSLEWVSLETFDRLVK